MKFRLKADFIFEAEDIDHAFEVLSGHFASLADVAVGTTVEVGTTINNYPLWGLGEITIEPVADAFNGHDAGHSSWQ